MIDLVACEIQFLHHLAPVWHALPQRGRFLVDAGLVDRAAALGIDATPIDAEAVRGTSPPPLARPGDGPTALVASIGDTKVARRLGYRRFAFIEHGAGQSYAGAPGVNARNPSYPGGIDREDTGLFMVPNEYAAALWRRAYPGARVEVVGCPKLDTLPRKERSIGLECDPWSDLVAAARGHLRTPDETGNTRVVAHAILAASRIELDGGSSQATRQRPSTTGSDTSNDDPMLLPDRIGLAQRLIEAARSAMSECTPSCETYSRASVTSAESLADGLRLLSAGTPLNRTGSSTDNTHRHSVRIQTTTFGSVSLAIPCTTHRGTSRATPSTPVVACSFHWPAFVAPEAGNALGTYAPVLADLAKRFHVIGHAHPKGDWPERMARIYRRAGIEFVRDFDEVCRRADLYVCDNSSTLFEFAATGRPVVVLNAPEFRRNVRHGGRFWDWATVGLQVDRAEDLSDTIDAALADPAPVREERERVLDLVYAHRTGAAERAAQAVMSWLAPVEVAA